MPQHLVWLFGRAGIQLMEANDGNGNDLPGGNTEPGEKAPEGGEKSSESNGEKLPEGEEEKPADKEAPKSGLNDEAAKLLRDVMKQKERAKAAEEQLTALKGVLGDLKPEEVAALVTQKKEQERLDLEKRGEYDRILEQVRSENAKEKGTLAEQIAALQSQLSEKDNTIQEMTVGRSFSESSFIREQSKIPASIARKEFGSHVELVDGQVVVYDKPKGAADRTPFVDADGKYKSFEDGIASLYTKHPEAASLIKVKGKPGSGSQNLDLGGKKPDAPGKAEVYGVSRISQALAAKNQ